MRQLSSGVYVSKCTCGCQRTTLGLVLPPPLCGFWELNLVPAALRRAALYFLHVIGMDIINASSNLLPHIADSAWQSWSHHCWQSTLS